MTREFFAMHNNTEGVQWPRVTRRWGRLFGLGALALAMMLPVGCGSDSGSSRPSGVSGGSAQSGQQRRAANQANAQGNQQLQFHVKIDDLIGVEEARAVRRSFTRDDFGPDIAGGTSKRDPFRSQTNQGNPREPIDTPKPQETCNNYVANDYSLRDLKLVGIVLRGTRSYALFLDSINTGHIVRRNDCLGLEKAQVVSVRAGFVTLRINADASAGQDPTAPLAEDRTIALYPEELQVEGQ